MESYDVFLIGNFLVLPAFATKFGVLDAAGDHVVVPSWQSALQMSGQLGALIGVFLAGPLTSRIGYRWATLTGLMLLNIFIFIFYFAESLPVMFVAQLLEGIPWGIFIANAPAYCSEIVPIQLRAPATQMLQMFWAIGSIIVGAVTYHYNTYDSVNAYKIPIALQWMFPTPLMILIFIAPESPWWLVRKGRLEEAAKAAQRLGRKSMISNPQETVDMMRRVINMEASAKKPGFLELFKGTDFRRTAIVCGVYAAQNLTGNLIANQAVYFFKRTFKSRHPPNTHLLILNRGWHQHRHRFCSRSYHFRPADDLRHAFLDSHHLLRSSFHLSLGFRCQHHPFGRPWCRWFCRQEQRCFFGPGLSRSHRLRPLHPRTCPCILGHYW